VARHPRGIAGVIAASGSAGTEIEAVGLTGQMHGCVMLDADGAVLRTALIWCDRRTQPQCDWLTEKIGFERLIELTCNSALPKFTLTKLLWVRDHQPEIFARIAHVLCPKDYVRYRLTGEFAGPPRWQKPQASPWNGCHGFLRAPRSAPASAPPAPEPRVWPLAPP